MAKVNIVNGFHNAVFEGLKIRATQMSENQRLCCLVFDEIAIKKRLTFQSNRDIVEGFETIETTGVPCPATHACVFMVKGLKEKWKQVIGYEFTHGTISVPNLKDLVLKCLRLLLDIGLHVKLIVCDQGSNNQSMYKKLGISPQEPYFYVNEEKIFAMYDPPHLIKSVRNNLFASGYVVNGSIINAEFIKKLYEIDSKHHIQLAPKLTY